MNGQQRTVLWIGLILVALNLVGRWGDIRNVVFSGAGIASGIGGGGGGGIQVGPTIPGFPGVQIPGTPIHVLSHKTKSAQVM